MEGEMEYFGGWMAVVLCGLLCISFARGAARNNDGGVLVFLLMAVVSFFLSGILAFEQGKSSLKENVLDDSHLYLVKGKGQSSFGTPLLVYDITDKRERVLVLKEYPPASLVETVTTDGKTILLPQEK